MNKQEYIKRISDLLEQRKTNRRENFIARSFINPLDETDGELTITGAQITVVLSEQANVKYRFYKVDEEYLKNGNRQVFIDKIKKQYPGIIFFVCNVDNDNESKTIDTENNCMVVDNNDFDASVELCGNINAYIKTMM